MKPIVNPQDIATLTSVDNLFAAIDKQYGTPPGWQRPEGFITLSKIILEQQVSLASAQAHFTKLHNYIPSFQPQEILKISDDEMKACFISRQKAAYLRALSDAVLSKTIDLQKLSQMEETNVRSSLLKVKGIGNWTVDIYLMFCLQTKDIFPIGDVAVVSTVRELTNAVTKGEILAKAGKWKPLRSLASYFLWHYYLCKRKRVALI